MTHFDGFSDRDDEQSTGNSAGNAGFSDITRTSVAHDAAALAPDAETAEYARPRCESCGMFAMPGSTLCEPCQRSFAGVLQPAAMASGFGSLGGEPVSEAVTIVEPPPPAGPPADIEATLERPYPFARADAPVESEAQTVIAPPIRIEQQTLDADALPSIQPAIAAATPDLDEPRPWWERQHDATQDAPIAEPAFVPRGPAIAPPVNDAPAPYVPQYVAPPAIAPAPQVGVSYGNGAPSIGAPTADHATRRNVQPRVAKPLPMAPPPVRKGRGALISGAVVLVVAAVGAPFAWNWSGLGASRVENTVTMNESAQQADTATRAAERTRPRPSTQYGSARATKPVAVKAPAAPAPKPKRPAPVKTPVAAPIPNAPTLSASALSTAFVPAVTSAPAPPPPPPPQDDPTPTGPVFEVAQVDMRPDIASRVDPVMPSHLSARRVEDVVVLRVLVSAGGSASEIRVLRRARVDAALDAAAIAAVRQWRFVPARKKGQAVRCWYNIGVSFSSTGE
jgi:protein TonB